MKKVKDPIKEVEKKFDEVKTEIGKKIDAVGDVAEKSIDGVIEKSRKFGLNKLSKIIFIIIFLFTLAIMIYLYANGYFSSIEKLQAAISKTYPFAPLVLILVQILSVAFPFIPSTIGCVTGVVLFGPFQGFIYSYIGLVLGSIFAFYLSRKNGHAIIDEILPKKTRDKYYNKLYKTESKLIKTFHILIFIPGAPDDILCYLIGTTSIKWRSFLSTVVIGKIPSVLLYSVGADIIIGWVYGLFA